MDCLSCRYGRRMKTPPPPETRAATVLSVCGRVPSLGGRLSAPRTSPEPSRGGCCGTKSGAWRLPGLPPWEGELIGPKLESPPPRRFCCRLRYPPAEPLRRPPPAPSGNEDARGGGRGAVFISAFLYGSLLQRTETELRGLLCVSLRVSVSVSLCLDPLPPATVQLFPERDGARCSPRRPSGFAPPCPVGTGSLVSTCLRDPLLVP